MHRIRTDLHALILNALLVGALAQPVTAAGLLSPLVRRNTVDAYVVQGLAPGLTSMALLWAGHLLLRRRGVVSRLAYAGLGAGACVLGMAPWASWEGVAAVAAQGQVVVSLAVLLVAGAVFGFLYVWRAGLEAGADAPARLVEALAEAPPEAPTVAADGETWFDGPVQVRTSVPVMFVAALLGLGVFGVLRALVTIGEEVQALSDASVGEMARQAVWALLPGGFQAAFFLIAGTLPVTGMIFVGHMLARGLKRSGYLAYGLIGLVSPAVLAVTVMFWIWGLALMLAPAAAVAMLVYRNMAGLEPVPVREDVRVRDRRDLVGADHPRRRFGRVVQG